MCWLRSLPCAPPRCILLTTTLCVALLRSSGLDAQSVRQQDAERVILDVRIGDIASASMPGLRVGDAALLPVLQVLSLAELHTSTSPPKADAYVSTDSLTSLLHEQISVDWELLVVSVTDNRFLPVSRRLARIARRDSLAHARMLADSMPSGRTAPVGYGGIALDYAATFTGPLTHARFDPMLSAAVPILGGSLRFGWRGGAAGHGANTVSWIRSLATSQWIKQLRIGDLAGSPLGATIVNGIEISSSPIVRPGSFERFTVTDSVGPGWFVETYQDGVLVAIDSADARGRYATQLLSHYGSNEISTTAFGPSGEKRIAIHHRVVPNDLLPRGAASYDLAMGSCAQRGCTGVAAMQLRFAPSSRVTVGPDFFVTPAPEHSAVVSGYSAIAALSDAATAAIQRSGEGSLLSLQILPSSNVAATATLRSDSRSSTLHDQSALARTFLSASAYWHPRRTAVPTYILATLAARTSALESVVTGRLSVSALLGGITLSPSLGVSKTRRGESIHHNAFGGMEIGIVPSQWPLMADGSVIQLRAQQRSDALPSEFGGAFSVPIARQLHLRTQLAWQDGASRPTLALSLQAISIYAHYSADISRRAGDRADQLYSAEGSMHLTASRRSLAVSPASAPGVSQLRGTVFVDANRNGRRDPYEDVLPGVHVRVGDIDVDTDVIGEYVTRDAPSYIPLTVQLDAATLPDGLAASPLRVELLPNQFARLDIAVQPRHP